MTYCDICGRSNGFKASVTINKEGDTKHLDLCGVCWDELFHAERYHKYLAYAEVVERRTGKPLNEKPSFLDRLRGNK